MSIVDAHVHLWDQPHPWTEPFPLLQRPFLVGELAATLHANGVGSAVVVQASDTPGETLDLLALAGSHDVIAGVVGWAGLTRADVPAQIGALRAAPGGRKLVGLRHQLQDEPDKQWIARESVRTGLAAIGAADLVFDICVSPWQLPLVTETVTAVPGTRFVLDHAAKPPIRSGDLAAWRADLFALAERPNVAVKLSGLVTEADWEHWTPAQIGEVVEYTVAVFGPERCLVGSDWPVCLLAADYAAVRASTWPEALVDGTAVTQWYR